MKKISYVFATGATLALLAASYVTSGPASPVKTTSATAASACCRIDRPGPPTYTFKRIPSSAIHHGHAAVPNMRITRGLSLNWSGYAVTNSEAVDSFTDVRGSWIVPEVVRTKGGQTYSAAWAGIDGYNSGTVEQIGTEHDWSGHSAEYYAWFEMYPDYGYLISDFPVSPGDRITAQVSFVGLDSDGNQVFSLTIENVSAGTGPLTVPPEYTTVPAAAPAQLASAEWVMEAPSFVNRVLNLADFGTIQFSDCYANGQPIMDYLSDLDPITMVGTKGKYGTPGFRLYEKAVPSDLTGTGFSVAWSHQ